MAANPGFMKKLFLLLIAMNFFSQVSFCQDNPSYDKALADSFGADEFGMKMYILVILKTGSNTSKDKAAADSLFKGHMLNMGRLSAEGKLIVAGPLWKNPKKYRGIFILNVKKEEAMAILETDPAIKAKLLKPEVYEWYGSAALSAYLPYHDKVQKTSLVE